MIASIKQAPLIGSLGFLWLISAFYLALAGQTSFLLLVLVSNSYELIFTWLTVRITRPVPPEQVAPKPAG